VFREAAARCNPRFDVFLDRRGAANAGIAVAGW
jgi:hypothetical protein